jgi:hypothetical protein
LTATYADIRQRVYRRKLDTPKTDNSFRQLSLAFPHDPVVPFEDILSVNRLNYWG